jgi:apolipoprotein D and lipocalin family protein
VGFTTAHYSLQPDKTLRVVNRCRRPDGRFEEAVGAGRQMKGPRSATLDDAADLVSAGRITSQSRRES